MTFEFHGPVRAGRIGDIYTPDKVVVRSNDGSVVLSKAGKLTFKVGDQVHTLDVPKPGKVVFKLVVAAMDDEDDSKRLDINSAQIEPNVEITVEGGAEAVTVAAGDVYVSGDAETVMLEDGNMTAQAIKKANGSTITVYADAVGKVKGDVVTVECKQCSSCAPSEDGKKKRKK